jgi:hypothetical protein
MMETKQQIIDGITYTTKTLPTTQGLVIMPKIVSLFGEPLLKLIFTVVGQGVPQEDRMKLFKSPEILGGLLGSIARNAAENDGLLVVKELLVATTADKVKIGEAFGANEPVMNHFDTHFAGRYMHLAEVAFWVASCNFLEL